MSHDQNGSSGAQRGPAPCTLREACVKAGLDRDGTRCPDCPIRELCQSDLRWLIKARPEARYPS